MISVIIVDDDIEVAKALKKNIDGKQDIVVTGVFSSGEEAVAGCREMKPDIVLLDIKMPGMDGIEVCGHIKRTHPHIKILILTFYQIRENEVAAVRCGCDGYLYKGHSGEEMIAIIKNTMLGFSTYENAVRETIHEMISGSTEFQTTNAGLEKLTDKQKEIVRLITAGRRDAEIAKELYISEGYLRNQLADIRERLGLRNCKELAVWGARAGL